MYISFPHDIKEGQRAHQVILVIACEQYLLVQHNHNFICAVSYRMGLGGGHRGQKVLHEAEDMPPTFNFLAGNQEAEENKALNHRSVARRALPFKVRTHRHDGPRNS
jgi:hypothetical protein